MPIVPNHRAILHMAIERGINYGLHRAFKHTDTPHIEDITTNVTEAVLAEIDVVFLVTDEDAELGIPEFE